MLCPYTVYLYKNLIKSIHTWNEDSVLKINAASTPKTCLFLAKVQKEIKEKTSLDHQCDIQGVNSTGERLISMLHWSFDWDTKGSVWLEELADKESSMCWFPWCLTSSQSKASKLICTEAS